MQESTFSWRKTRNVPPLPHAETYPEVRVTINENKLQDLKKLKECIIGHEAFYDAIFNFASVKEHAAQTSMLDSNVEEDDA